MTIKDVAALARVSVGTASRVLSGSTATSPDSRERVRAAAAQLGYRPNARARSLRSTRTNVVGLLVSDVRNPFFADIAHGAEQAALRSDYITLLANADEDTVQQDTYLEAFLAQRVDGVILAPQGLGRGNLSAIVDTGTPLVFVDRVVDGFDLPSVTTDNASGIEQAVVHLAERGHTRIGYIGGPRSISTGAARLEAFTGQVARLGLDDDPALLVSGDFRSESGIAATERLLAGPRRPTALLAADSPMAVGALAGLRRHGMRVGRDIDLVAFDDTEWFAELDPPLTVVAHDAEAMGATAMRLLLAVMAGERPESVVLPARLVVRGSSGGAPAHGSAWISE